MPEVMQQAILDTPKYRRIAREVADLPINWCKASRRPPHISAARAVMLAVPRQKAWARIADHKKFGTYYRLAPKSQKTALTEYHATISKQDTKNRLHPYSSDQIRRSSQRRQ
jgi:hypothetical protein